MKFEKTEVFNFEGALRGMRNPMNSWEKSDSRFIKTTDESGFVEIINIGENDLKLAQKLILNGTEHSKFLRQIFVSVDITAPLYWWKEFDTYKVGTVANSTSTMHKLASTSITKGCFEMDDYSENLYNIGKREFHLQNYWFDILECLEGLRQKYNETKDKRYWKELIRLLPESWLQKRTVTMDYENLRNMAKHRKNHKLTEWSKSFIDWVKSLPYAQELIFI